MKKILSIIIILSVSMLFAVLPHPDKNDDAYEKHKKVDKFTKNKLTRKRTLPDKILVLRVDFSDVTFSLEPNTETNPDDWGHDLTYFERLLFHMKTYWKEASYGQYIMDYTVHEEVIHLPKTMGYYGDDDNWSERIVEFAVSTIQLADEQINFNDYDEVLVFHAGPGQESDMSGNNTDCLWTTFLTIDDIQEQLDPENENFQGIPTEDGKYITQMPICPESEWQSDNDPLPEDGSEAPLGIFGVSNHEFGHTLGLPTLFDNDSSNGKGYGIGNFGIMGTGSWNANGHFPPLPISWCRYYLGWENPEIIREDAENLEIASFFKNSFDPKSYIIPISDREYFLLENLEENPDFSVIGGLATHSFELLEEGQDFYPAPNDNFPKFNFMENTYENSEWNFYCPGLGGPNAPIMENDGSGILIWHIDENIIREKLTPDLQENSINSYFLHKGVDLEEADGVQHMDSQFPSNKILGSEFDAFKAPYRRYFGKKWHPETGELKIPTAKSYYGGIPFEITGITTASDKMTFSVNFFDEKYKAAYAGKNPYSPLIKDLDLNGENEILYPMLNDTIFVWENEILKDKFSVDSLAMIYSVDENTVVFPSHDNDSAKLYKYNNSEVELFFDSENAKWASPLVVFKDSVEENSVKSIISMNSGENCKIVLFNASYGIEEIKSFSGRINSNLISDENEKIWFVKDNSLVEYNFIEESIVNVLNLEDEDIISIASIPQKIDGEISRTIVIQSEDKIFKYYADGSTDFFNLSGEKYSKMNFADINHNGTLDILLGLENSFEVYELYGEKVNQFTNNFDYPDSSDVVAPILGYNFKNDSKNEILGNFSKNRFAIWNDELEIENDYPYPLYYKSRNLPIVAVEDSSTFVYIGTDNGLVIKHKIAETSIQEDNIWTNIYCNLKRTAWYDGDLPENFIENDNLIVETVVYPCPFIESQHEKIQTDIIINQDSEIKVRLFDVAGNLVDKKVYEGYKYVKNHYIIPHEKLSSGVYFLLINVKGEFVEKKFVIEK